MRFQWILPALAAAATGCAGIPVDTLRAGGVRYPPDPAGLLERLAAGNVDQPGSAAYNRWGAGYDAGIQASDRRLQPPGAASPTVR